LKQELASNQLRELQRSLLDWFDEYQRKLPWRENYHPYEVWISEIMLQQTQMKTMLPYYKHWMNVFPEVRAIAKADEELLMKLWEGLGYYRRVRNIRKTAEIICQKYDGTIPRDFNELLKLPGIGRYTAGAIASIGFNQPAPILDGNVTRVLCRLQKIIDPPQTSAVVKKLWRLAEEWIPQGKARYFNQALMELGAIVCMPTSPRCLFCPIHDHCQAFSSGTVDQIPLKIRSKVPKQRFRVCAVIRFDRSLLFNKRPKNTLLEGLWEFPSMEGDSINQLKEKLEKYLMSNHGITISLGKEFHHLDHRYTSFKTRVSFHEAIWEESQIELDETSLWVDFSKIKELALPSPYRKFLDWYFKKIEK
jgi:A/G-specific adenine glycosylase